MVMTYEHTKHMHQNLHQAYPTVMTWLRLGFIWKLKVGTSLFVFFLEIFIDLYKL